MRRLSPCLIIMFAVACGGTDNNGGGNPNTPTPSAIALAIIGDGNLRTGQNQTLRADVSFSNGTTQAATSPSWSSSNQTVATVSSSGVVSAANHGNTTISVSAQGLSAQLPVQVWQDYQGAWTGSYIINVCTNTGIFATDPSSWCSMFPPGKANPFRVTLTQTNGTASGTLELGSFIGTISGSVFDSRRFIGAGSASMTVEGFVFTASVGTFDVLSTGNSLAGNLVVNTTALGLPGNGYWEATLGTVTRSLSAPQLDTREFKGMLGRFVLLKR